MKIFEYIDRINLLNKLIEQRKTGNPKMLAKRLNVSPSRLYDILDDLKLMGAPIEYSRQIGSYYYVFAYKMSISSSFAPLSSSDLEFINGGAILGENNLPHSFFCLVR